MNNRNLALRIVALAFAFAVAGSGGQLMDCARGTISSSSFGANATQEVAILTGLSANVRYKKILLSETVKFDSISGLTVSMGRPGSTTNNEIVDGFALGVSSGDANFDDFGPKTPQLTSTYSLVLAFAVRSGALKSATAGVLTWEVCGYGTLNVVQTPPYPTSSYLVGDVAPYTSDTAPNFGDGVLDDQDLTQIMFAVNNVPGFPPTACSDRFDAMDVYPTDTALARGGDGVLDIRDLVRAFLRVNKQDSDRPVRVSRGGLCSGVVAPPARSRNRQLSLGPRVPPGAPRPGSAKVLSPRGATGSDIPGSPSGLGEGRCNIRSRERRFATALC
jgi:hypothetical protein